MARSRGLGPGTILACFGKSIVVFLDPFGSLLHCVLSWVPSFEGRFGNLELLIELLLYLWLSIFWVLLPRYRESIFGQFRLILVGPFGFHDKLQSYLQFSGVSSNFLVL